MYMSMSIWKHAFWLSSSITGQDCAQTVLSTEDDASSGFEGCLMVAAVEHSIRVSVWRPLLSRVKTSSGWLGVAKESQEDMGTEQAEYLQDLGPPSPRKTSTPKGRIEMSILYRRK